MAEVVLIVDDDPVQRRLLEAMIQRFGYRTAVVEGGDAACKAADWCRGRTHRRRRPRSCHAGSRRAWRAGAHARSQRHRSRDRPDGAWRHRQHRLRDRAGATDFVVKPASAERLQVSLRNALATNALAGELQRLKRKHEGTFSIGDVITRSSAMQPVLKAAEKAAASAISVLVEGESGVGKELIARAIHGSGARRTKPFVAVNCGALPETLVELILFGHEKGAFTGATEKHSGQIPRGLRRHLVPRRDRRIARAGAGEAAARPAGRRGRAGRRAQEHQGRCPDRFGHQPRPDRRREGGPVPRGPVLSPARISDFSAAPSRCGATTFPS